MIKKISAIWAQDEKGLIGKEGRLPWSLPADFEHFKAVTSGHAMVMGRLTFDGMGQRALPNRQSLVLTRDEDYQFEHDRVTIFHSVDEILDWYKQQDRNLYVIGGSQIFSAFEPFLDQVIMTDIHGQFEGDVYFPKDFDWSAFEEKESLFREKDAANTVDFTIRVFERRVS
ncbi:dihydrofolate reductase [Streptococcus suis]|uniref:Dihydrofolate reductase n=1 Tax=Streptococcus suis TaxID=1307 RepID=A0A4T2GPT5_STRSU|nr:dihydrofolate reductase [Streptococcus suis]MBM7269005.1 dihydrofolate reductase [Streptococcus suis]MBM7269281.1 dihydrofolate reductase [Streptococcus suis]TII00062.1 dihydrofolate reductase [Streptococcus suis]TII01043.1 dihydrofolate reductase [Streptococcus suis]